MVKVTKKFLEEKLQELKEDGIPEDLIDKIRDKIKDEDLEEEQLEYFLNKIFINYTNAIVEASEPVGTVAAQSIGEPGTQMSIPGTEKVIIKEGNYTKILNIGDFIDELMSNAEILEHVGDCEVLNLDSKEIKVPCLGQDEKIHWGRIQQVSRHPAKREILRIKTRSGRSIEATLSHSFLMRKNNKIIPVEGRTLKIGDRIPLIKNLPTEDPIDFMDIKQYVSKKEAWFGSELNAVKESKDWMGRNRKEEFNIEYTIPVGVNGLLKALKTGKNDLLQDSQIYPKTCSNPNIVIPDKLPLNFSFGWIMGAYLSEGTNAGNFIALTNIDENFKKRVLDFANSYSISWSLKEEKGEFGPNSSIILSSSLLGTIFKRLCGKGARNKFIPSWALNAPDDFIAGLLQAYFDGDGNFSAERMQIRASTSSKELRDGICLLLSRFGIIASKYKEKNCYCLRISGKYAPTYKKKIGSIISEKNIILNKIVERELSKDSSRDSLDIIPGFGKVLNNLYMKLKIDAHSALAASIKKYTRKQKIRRQTLHRYIKIFERRAKEEGIDISEELNILHKALQSDIIWDEIISIRLIKSPTPYLYDFSIENHENFTTAEGLITHNTLRTFHYAGVEEFSVTQGLPRLIEIVDARRFPSTPQMTIYLEEPYNKSEEEAIKVHNRIEQIRIEQITSDADIDFVNWNIVVNLIPELCEKKGINVDEIPEILKRYKKKGTIKREKNSIIIDPGIEDLQSLQKLREKILKKVIKGIRGIKRGLLTPTEDGNEWVIKTEGTNLQGAIQIEGVDPTRTISNHLHEVEKLFGIEAARNLIIIESQKVLEQQGLDVDLRHLLILADLMCSTGTIQSIGRHGISGSKSSVFARAAFEVTVNQLLDAGLYGEEERLLGIPENVIVGQVSPIGTGSVHIMFDLDKNLELIKSRKK
ncbi:MAG: DNA-directed RNA polymerase subunit A'' [Promethearchaeota archaeon]